MGGKIRPSVRDSTKISYLATPFFALLANQPPPEQLQVMRGTFFAHQEECLLSFQQKSK